MCNLYSLTRGQAAIRELARAMRDTTGNLPPLPGIFPDQMAPVVRGGGEEGRELAVLRWGFPPVAKAGARPITNVRNLASPYWRGWIRMCRSRWLGVVSAAGPGTAVARAGRDDHRHRRAGPALGNGAVDGFAVVRPVGDD